MRFEIYNDESKVHLVLSNECNYCLENDANSFGITKGSLVNKIICNYYNDANASKEYKTINEHSKKMHKKIRQSLKKEL